MRCSAVFLIGVLLSTLGWANVLLAMTARGVVRLLHGGAVIQDGAGEVGVVIVGLAVVAASWVVLRRGAGAMQSRCIRAADTRVRTTAVAARGRADAEPESRCRAR